MAALNGCEITSYGLKYEKLIALPTPSFHLLTGKMAALESFCPAELEKHLQMNANRLDTYEAMREEVKTFVEVRAGIKIKDAHHFNELTLP